MLCFSFFFLFCRPRRRSGSSIVVLGGSDSIDDYIKSDNIEHYRITDGTYRDSHDLEMLTMMPINQDNGMYHLGSGFALIDTLKVIKKSTVAKLHKNKYYCAKDKVFALYMLSCNSTRS